MSSPVKAFSIIDKDKNSKIFNTSDEYVIPLYQRAYAWEDKQLLQLIEDVNDIADGVDSYYIGSLIVSKQNDRYEVVDGQQRLTSLYLLLNCLEIKTNLTLSFACREKSNYTLRNIKELISENYNKLDMDRIEPSIQRGIKILSRKVKHADFNKDTFIGKLSKVKIYRIEVPQKTDLNRYFEIMNTRGEQLEQHDILKATLMSYLNDSSDRVLFAKIWDACSDMTGYVQMHFVSKNNIVRESIFGSEWNSMPSNEWAKYKDKTTEETTEKTNSLCIPALIAENFKVEDDEGYVDGDVRVRFESVIEFPYFLLHALKVYISINGITHEKAESKIVDELLDDKKLLDAFNRVVTYGYFSNNEKIFDDKETFARTFIVCLLRTRFLFDKYIIKREYANDNVDGEWSLKSLHGLGHRSQKKPYYKNSKFTKEKDSTNDHGAKTNIMIQSALRVSYTSPKVMHWITKLLIWLSESDCAHINNDDITSFDKVSENIAINAVKENFFDLCTDGQYAMGVNTPHIVFNYLDYLLWKKDTKKYDDFEFEFRNSVEHWYPQNPSKDTFVSWNEVDQFGNLCIIQSNINSRFSNMSPEAKKSTFKDKIAKGSIKLRIMSELTKDNNWKDKCSKHGNEMIEILKKACNPQKTD